MNFTPQFSFVRTLALGACLSLGLSSSLAQTSVTTVPVGAMMVTIAAGTGVSSKLTAVSVPLLLDSSISGKVTGVISSFSANTITSTGAGWLAGQLSVDQTPYMIRITSGSAIGRTFLVSTSSLNTIDTLTIDATEAINLTTIGLAINDSYQILPVHTLASVLTPTDGVFPGADAYHSDNVLINKNGVWNVFYYSTSVTPNRWTRVALGSPDASNEVIRPDSVILYKRLANTAMSFTFTGSVPLVSRSSAVRNSGLTFLASNWPIDMTIASLQLNTISGWVSNANPYNADKVLILSSGVWKTYYYDGTNWRQITLGFPICDSDPVAAATGVLINRLGTSTSLAIYNQATPYSL